MTINIINNQYICQQYNPFINMQFLYCYHTPSELFFDSLTKEINNYCNLTYKNIEYLNTIRCKYLKKIEKLIQFGLEKKYQIKFGHYGSYFTNLSIEGSDLDILVFYKPNNPNFDFLKDIIDLLNNHENEFECIHPILSASVPVIKLQFNISSEIDHKKIQFLPYFDNKDISHIKIDLTFTFDENEFKRPDQIVCYINKNIEDFCNIKPLLLVLKRYFRIMKMNKSYTGGLSSHSLFLLVLAFFKSNALLNSSQLSLGKSLFFFFEKYSFFNYNDYGIDVEVPPFYYLLNENLNSIFNDYENRKEEINIIDPFTKLNVAKSSFQVDEIKNTFNKALFFFKFEAWKYDSNNYQIFNNNINTINNINNINNLTITNNNNNVENDFIVIKKLFSIK
jgi:DNA polymerase sigma